jgi:hypothetical protein
MFGRKGPSGIDQIMLSTQIYVDIVAEEVVVATYFTLVIRSNPDSVLKRKSQFNLFDLCKIAVVKV